MAKNLPLVEKEPAPPISEFRPLVKGGLEKLAKELHKQRAIKSAAEKEIKKIEEKMDPLFEAVDLPDDAVQINEMRLKKVSSHAADRIDGTKLLNLGVKAVLIKEATVAGKPYHYYLTTVPKDGSSE